MARKPRHYAVRTAAAAGRRVLPAIPLTTTTTTTTANKPNEQRQQHETSFQTRSSTLFDDDGHYTDIHFNVDGGGGAAARIPAWRRSFVDEPDHYNYLEFDQPTSAPVEQRQRPSADNYEGLNEAGREPPSAPRHYTGIRSRQSRDSHGYLQPVEVR